MKRLSKEDRAGIYLTIIAHLSVIIIALVAGLNVSLRHGSTFELDFSELEQLEKLQAEKERLEKEISLKEEIAARIERKLESGEAVRSIAVNRGALKDDRGTDADKLYKDAERLKKELQRGYGIPDEDEYVAPVKSQENQVETTYSGPSVLDWSLEGRKASHLPIPAYRCMGAGTVKVIIDVDPQGKVINAKIDNAYSSSDGCLRNFAVHASRSSRFSKSTTAPPRQRGYIIYQFIAQ